MLVAVAVAEMKEQIPIKLLELVELVEAVLVQYLVMQLLVLLI
jgi:hypothetical protein